MPNHIKNKIVLLGDMKEIDNLIKTFGTYHEASIRKTHDDKLFILKKKGDVFSVKWFNPESGFTESRDRVIEQGIPKDYEIEIQDSFFGFPDFKKVIPPPDNDAYNDRPSQKEAELSPDWWYTWNCKHWGTKWGSYSCERPSINEFTFETAWASVPLIVDKISRAFPNVSIEYSWADEDTGYNCGSAVYRNGLITQTIPKGGSKKAYELAFELRPDKQEHYELVGGVYKYKDE